MTRTESMIGADAISKEAAIKNSDADRVAQMIADIGAGLPDRIRGKPDYMTLAKCVVAAMRDAMQLSQNAWLMTAHYDSMRMSQAHVEALLSGMGDIEAAFVAPLVADQRKKIIVFSDASMIDMTTSEGDIDEKAADLLEYDFEDLTHAAASTLISWIAEEVACGDIEVFAVSPALAARGGVQSWLKAGTQDGAEPAGDPEPEENQESSETLYPVGRHALASILERVFEEIEDPKMDDEDYISEQNWDDDDVDRIEDTLTTIVAAVGYRENISIEIVAGWQNSKAEILISANTDTAEQAAQVQLIEELIGVLVDIDVFIGAETEYNDGASDRRSGYDDYAKTVGIFEIDINSLSAHKLMSAQGDIKAMLSKAGVTPNGIEALFSIGRAGSAAAPANAGPNDPQPA